MWVQKDHQFLELDSINSLKKVAPCSVKTIEINIQELSV